MSIRTFIDGIRFNFVNFFAFWIFNCCFFIWLVITLGKYYVDSPHVAEIRNTCGNLALIIVGYFFGSAKASASKDETIKQVMDSNTKKDEAIKTLSDAASDKAND